MDEKQDSIFINTNYQNEILRLKNGVNYFYDGSTKNHKIEAVTSLEVELKLNIVYLGIYLEYNL